MPSAFSYILPDLSRRRGDFLVLDPRRKILGAPNQLSVLVRTRRILHDEIRIRANIFPPR